MAPTSPAAPAEPAAQTPPRAASEAHRLSLEYVIDPPRRGLSLDVRELWRYRELFLSFAWRDIAVRYKQTALGALWAIGQPLVTMVVFTAVFNRMAHIESGDGTPYPVFLYVGMLLWQYFAGTVTRAAESMVTNAQMIQKIYFPRVVVPAAASIAGLVDLVFAALVLAGMMAYYHVWPRPTSVAVVPVLLLACVLCATGVGMFLAALNVKYRDVRYALPFVIQTLMYVTPVIYPVSMLDRHPAAKVIVLWANPMSGVITNARAAVLGRSPVLWSEIGISVAASLLLFLVGLAYFRRTEHEFADIV